MADALGFATAALDAAVKLYNLIKDLAEADEMIKSANDSLNSTISVLQDLTDTIPRFENDPALSDGSAVRSALKGCMRTCQGFQAILDKCTQHSKPGKFSLRDRWTSVLKRSDINKFNGDLGTQRQILLVGMGSLNLRSSIQTVTSLTQFQKTTEDAIKHLDSQIQSFEFMKERLDEDNPQMKDINDQLSELQKQLQFCRQSLEYSQENPSCRQVFQDQVFQSSMHNFQGSDMSHKAGLLDQEYRNTRYENSAFNFQGVYGAETIGEASKINRALPLDQSQKSGTRSQHETEARSSTAHFVGKGNRLGG
ncbi:hypothetical protein BFW01_g1768 [Lasiodiplodia theobromae]|nr:hypothetical protein BFW01_g1768 [Lasiodiplodia theobromae]